MNTKMKIEVWTDIMCPYCYIGKIHYERALKQFAHADEVELIIKAFQLNPNLPDKGNGYPVVEYLTKTAGYPEDNMKQMFAYLEQLAKNAGVKFNVPNAIAANTLDAHRLIKLAATIGKDSEVMMALSKAYFEDAKDYSDIELLVKIGTDAGLQENAIRQMLAGDDYKAEVKQDIEEAHALNIDTVPTFLFDRKQAIIGSEPVEVFLETLNKSFNNWKSSQPSHSHIEVKRGRSCNADGTCEI